MRAQDRANPVSEKYLSADRLNQAGRVNLN